MAARISSLNGALAVQAVSAWRHVGGRGGFCWRRLSSSHTQQETSQGKESDDHGGDGNGSERTRFEVVHLKNTFRLIESLKSANEVQTGPDFGPYPEICIAGRTNAGKSSLVNHLREFHDHLRKKLQQPCMA
jgi:hypothetical protein